MNLTVLPVYYDTIRATICQNETYTFNNTIYNLAGNYTVRFSSVSACDSNVTLALTITPLPIRNISSAICYGATYTLPNNRVVNVAGTYIDTVAVINNCDSVLITTLTIRALDSNVVTRTICNNQLPYVWNGISVPAAGNAVARYSTINQFGCDSIVVLNLVVNNVTTSTMSVTRCSNQLPYNFNGTNIFTAGTYTSTLLNSNGCDSVITLTFNVNNISADTIRVEICDGNTYTFYNNTYNTSGYYAQTFTNVLGCDSIKTLNLIVHPLPSAPIINTPVVYCQNATVTNLTATGSNLLWYPTLTGGVGSNVAPIPSTTNMGTTYYYVSQTVNGCEGPRATIEVRVLEKPILSLNVLPDSTICSDDVVYVTYTGSNYPNALLYWDWAGANASGAHPTYTLKWDIPGSKTIRLWMNNNGCISDTLKQTVKVNLSPNKPIIRMPKTACVNESVTISSSEHNAAYHWTINGASVNAGNSFARQWSTSGWKVVTLMIEGDNQCLSSLVTDSIYIAEYPNAKIDYNADWVCADDTLILNLVNPTANTNYVWGPSYYFGDGMNNIGHQATAFITHKGNVFVTATNAYGCVATDSVWVNAVACCDVFIPNAFSPNGDGLNDEFYLITEAHQQIKEFSIYNRYGQRVYTSHNTNDRWDGTLHGKPCDAGVYFFYIDYTCNDGKNFKKKGDLTLIR